MPVHPGWGVDEAELLARAGEGEATFARIELGRSPDHYLARVRALGLEGHGRVLDAACGMGQWTLALARVNRSVHGVDLSAGRLRAARLLLDRGGAPHAGLARADLLALPFADRSFDAVCCYGVLMLVHARSALRELARVLRPGGTLYLCANGPGWSLYVILRRGWVRRGLRTIARTLLGRERRDNYLTHARLEGLCREAGLVLTGWGGEGTLLGGASAAAPPAYRATFLGLPCVFEALAVRSPDREPGP